MSMLRVRRYDGRYESDYEIAGVLRRVLEAVDQTGLGPARVRFLFEDAADGQPVCAKIIAKYQDLARFSETTGGQWRLLNFDASWDVANPAAANEPVATDSLLAVTEGIPQEFPLGCFVFVIGPVAWTSTTETIEIPAKPVRRGGPSFATRFPSVTYLAPGVIVQRLGSGKMHVTITETIDAPGGSPPVVSELTRALNTGPGREFAVAVRTGATATEPSTIGNPNAQELHTRFRSTLPQFMANLSLPHALPAPEAMASLPREPVGEVRQALVRAFKSDGWKKATGLSTGTHRLWKATPNGRSLVLDFETGSWLRFVVCYVKLVTDKGLYRLAVPADRTMRSQYLTPNPAIFGDTVENLTVVLRALEQSWVQQLEEALGPVPADYRPPEV